jgi:splicing factor 3B subunit 4
MVDEKLLYATFERFGRIVAPPKISRDENNLSKGFGFISYDSFEAADAAIANMHGQYFMNKEVTVQYAYKKDGKGERHGDAAERALAAQAQAHGVKVDYQPLPVGLTVPVGTPMGPSNPSYRPPYNPNYYPQGGYGYPNYGQSPYNAGQFPPPSGSYTVPVAPPQPFAPGQTPYGYQPPLTFNTALPPPGTYGAAGQS